MKSSLFSKKYLELLKMKRSSVLLIEKNILFRLYRLNKLLAFCLRKLFPTHIFLYKLMR